MGALSAHARPRLRPEAKLKEVFTSMRGAARMRCDRSTSRRRRGGDIEIETTHVTADMIRRTIRYQNLSGRGRAQALQRLHLFQEKAVMMIQMSFFRIPLWLAPRHYLIWKRTGREIASRSLFPSAAATRPISAARSAGTRSIRYSCCWKCAIRTMAPFST